MQKESFVENASKFIKPNECDLLEELVLNTENTFIERWYLEFLTFSFKDFKAVVLSLKEVLRKTARKKAEVGKIKGFKGSREQEKNALEYYFYLQLLQNKPQWFREFKEKGNEWKMSF